MPSENRKAIVLLSGGLDSMTTAGMAKEMGFALYALTFRYGQRHDVEVIAAERIARVLDVRHHAVLTIDLRSFGGSALTDDIDVPKSENASGIGREIPVTYVPARNTIFLSFALAYAEVTGACDIFIGVNAVDYSGYPDCRPAFIEAFQTMAQLATRAAVEGAQLRIHTPLINMSKGQIIREGMRLGLDYSLTHSCYDPRQQGVACGRCDSCLLRKQGFVEADVPDPIPYAC